MSKAIVLIPTYNEAQNIGLIIERTYAVVPNISVFVIDDNSPDGTADIVKAMQEKYPSLDILVRIKDRGFAKSYIDGFKKVLQDNRHDTVITMDADFSHDPKEIPHLLKLLGDGADVALGSRHTTNTTFPGISVWRQILSKFAQRYVQIILGLRIRDCTAGYLAIPTRVLSSINLNQFFSDGYGFLFELKYLLTQKGFVIKEHPVKWPQRHQGESKMSKRIIYDSILLPWKIRFSKTR
jgi:dolichol-phosphate mannosyltransferase